MFDFDFSEGQARDWFKLMGTIQDAEEQTPCTNFPDAFFPEKGAIGPEFAWAKSMCQRCPVQRDCAEYGIKWETTGIWGGLSPQERLKLRAKRPVA